MSGDFFTSPTFSESLWLRKNSSLDPSRHRIKPLAGILTLSMPENTLQVAFPKWPRKASLCEFGLSKNTEDEKMYAGDLLERLEKLPPWIQDQIKEKSEEQVIGTAATKPVSIPRYFEVSREGDGFQLTPLDTISTPHSPGNLYQLWKECDGTAPIHLPYRAMFRETVKVAARQKQRQQIDADQTDKENERYLEESYFARRPVHPTQLRRSAIGLTSRPSSVGSTIASIQLASSLVGSDTSTPTTSLDSDSSDNNTFQIQRRISLSSTDFVNRLGPCQSRYSELEVSRDLAALGLTHTSLYTSDSDTSQIGFVLPLPQILGISTETQPKVIANIQANDTDNEDCFHDSEPPRELMISKSEPRKHKNAKRRKRKLSQDRQRHQFDHHVSFSSNEEVIPTSSTCCLDVTGIGKDCTTSWWQRLVPWYW